MAAYGHLQRYGTRKRQDEVTDVEVRGDGVVSARGKLWDLRAGESKGWGRGFFASGDGRACEYQDADLVAVHADGTRVQLSFPERPTALKSGGVFWVGDFLVGRDQYTAPWVVVNAKTGAAVGRLVEQRKDKALGYCPSVFDPQDGATLIFCDKSGVQRVYPREAKVEDVLAAPAGIQLVQCALTSGGDWVLLERPTSGDHNNDTTRDAVVVRDARGREKARLAAGKPPFQLERLGDRLLLTDNDGFAILDDELRELARIPFVDDDTFARTMALPSGREWIAVGGFSQWDHYGDVTLAPPKSATGPSKKKAAAPAKKKAAAPAKKTAPKKKALAKRRG